MPTLPAVVPQRRARYALFKYTLYALLFVDCVWFMREDFGAAPHLFADGIAWRNFGTALAQSIDTWAWLTLLVLFELETSVFAPASIAGVRKWTLHLLRSLCYVVVIYACYGYIGKLTLFLAAEPMPAATDLCALAGSGSAYVIHLDNYVAIDPDNCGGLDTTSGLYRLRDADLVATAATLTTTRWLALTDVVNAAAWILVAAVLELEVWMQLAHNYRRRGLGVVVAAKVTLYLTLAGAALYWGIAGTFLDFWDAWLWIAAFVFIEINVFQWGHDAALPGEPDSSARAGVWPAA